MTWLPLAFGRLTIVVRRLKWYWYLLCAVLIGGLFWWLWNGEEVEIVKADRGPIIQTVSVSGKTLSASAVDLAFEQSGQITRVAAEAGDKVVAGALLVALESRELAATIAAEEAKLAELKRGTRLEELALTEAELEEALRQAAVTADDAIYNTADTFFGSRRPEWRQNLFRFIPSNANLVNDLVADREELDKLLAVWRRAIKDGEPPTAQQVSEYLNEIHNFLGLLARGINDLEVGDNNDFTASEIEGYKNLLAASREEVANTLATLTAADRELTLKLTGTAPEIIAAQAAKVEQYRAALAKNYLYAPISGLVTKQEARVGEIAPAGETLVSVMGMGDLEVESLVPEVHIGRLSIGNRAQITLDAFPGVEFTGRITFIDPAETMIAGIPNYRIKVAFDTKDERLKSGLTANLKIETARKDNVIRLPRFALTERDGGFYVAKQGSEGLVLSSVTVGLIGTDGLAEIITGVNPGEEIIIPTEQKTET